MNGLKRIQAGLVKASGIKNGILMMLAAGFLFGCSENKPQQEQKQTVEVNVFDVKPLNFQLKTQLPARVLASEVAEIRPQVSGIIQKREFTESSMVEQGQSLYQIDPALYQAQYESAKANVESMQASLNNVNAKFKRYQTLIKSKAISQQDYDQAFADLKQAQANLNVAKASLNTAEVNLNYTKVISPISGYIGMSSVTEGALVSVGQVDAMAVVRKLDPIYVDMTQSASSYLQYQQHANQFEPINKVNLYLDDGSLYPVQGDVKFLERSVNETTGTVTIRSEFANANGAILPGMFVKPELIIGEMKNAIIVPQAAVTLGPTLTYSAVFLVPDEGTQNPSYHLEQRDNIKILQAITGYWVIEKGVNANEMIVTRGLMNLQGKDLNDPKVREALNVVIHDKTSLTQDALDQL